MQKIYDIGLIPRRDKPAERAMTPFSQINFLLNGITFSKCTLITSGTDNGKSLFSSQLICSFIEQGYNCACFFGEDDPYESQERIFKQASKGDESSINYVPYYTPDGKQTNCGEFILTDEAWKRAHEMFSGKLFLYNTKASTTADSLIEGFEEARKNYGCRIFLLDNVDQIFFEGENENKELKDDSIKLRDYAINNNVHIFIVAHMRKTERDVILPTIFDVKGTSTLTNIAKNILIIVRTDKLDHSSKEYQKLKRVVELNNYNLDEADCLVHVAKTKGRKVGFACLKLNKKKGIFFDCKKIDDNKEESENVQMFAPKKEPDLIPIDEDLSKIF